MADDLDDYRLVVAFEDNRVIRHLSYRSDRERGERKVRIEQQWAIEDKPLGSGGFGSVRLQSTADGSKRAVKAVLKSTAEKFKIDYKEEIRALTKFSKAKYSQHGLFVDFLGWYENDDFVFLAMEYLPLGDLSHWAKYSKSEGDLKTICQQLLEGLEIMHANGFMHRDLKPQRANPEPGTVRIGTTHIGTEGYLAPEVDPDMAVTLGCSPLTAGKGSFKTYVYTNAVDIWSLGCVLFQLVTNQLPFSPSAPKVLRKFCKGKAPFPGDALSGKIRQSGLELIQQLLTPSPQLRPSASQALQSSWILEGGVEDVPLVLHSNSALNSSSGQLIAVEILSFKKIKEQMESPTLSAGAPLGNDKTTRRPPIPQKPVPSAAISTKLTASSTPGRPAKSAEAKLGQSRKQLFEKRILQATYAGTYQKGLLDRWVHVNSHSQSENCGTALQDAASRGQENIIESLLHKGAKATENCENGCNSLHVAAAIGQQAIIRLLLLKNSKDHIDSKDCEGITSLMFAIMSKEYSMVRLLLERGADIAEKDQRGFNSLHIAASFGNETIFKLLLENSNFNIDSKNSAGETPLIQATRCNEKAMVKLLLQEGANVEAKTNGGGTSMLFAVANGYEEMVGILFETGKADVTWKTSLVSYGTTLLHIAAKVGYDGLVKYLLQTCKVNIDPIGHAGKTPLWIASIRGHNAVVQSLLQTGRVDINATDDEGFSPLTAASDFGREAVVRSLLRNKADVNYRQESSGLTPLAFAARKGHTAVVRALLDSNCNINCIDKHGRTPVMLAANDGHSSCVNLLLENGADYEAKNEDGDTALTLASFCGHNAVIQLCLEKNARLEVKDANGWTALLKAARNGHTDSVKLLLAKGANVESKGNDGRTALSIAARYGYKDSVKLLLAKGAELEIKDSWDMTPLMLAARGGHEAVVRILLEKGAEIGPKDAFGETALSRAKKARNEAIVQLLLDKQV
ncbi:Ankyrin repeat domain-containing protein [Lachnellula arida]|uniref:Ankyrin repeat domain-containing protein n=1 Tax=Lachnellula arida TaxID=1316785 RepID=A0A8T9BFK7_9HELO|nr:Ankyrin repeat domain-containing protein [Lachnellula arida]